MPPRTNRIGVQVEDTKICVVMVGLPARGKSYIAQKTQGYLQWLSIPTKTFNVGNYRRSGTPQPTADFFDTNNAEGERRRRAAADAAVADMMEFFSREGGVVGILDATNSTKERRKCVLEVCTRNNVEVLFVESKCDDEEIIMANIRDIKTTSPDYKGRDPEAAAQDLRNRIQNYEKVYKTIDIDNDEAGLACLKILNVGKQVIINRIQDYLQSRIVYYMMNLCIRPRSIWLSRHGESLFNLEGRIGGDTNLSPRGEQYARELPELVRKSVGDDRPLTVWTSTLRRTIATARFLPSHYNQLQWKALDELDSGVCDGMTYEEIQDAFPEDFAARDEDQYHHHYRGGESYRDVVNRLEPVIMELERSEDILIVAHLAVLRCIYAYLMKMDQRYSPRVAVPIHTLIKLTPRAYGTDEVHYSAQIAATSTWRGKGSKPKHEHPDAIRNIADPATPYHTQAKVSVVWELLQCIRDELGQDPHLSPVLTVTEESSTHAWAISCGEYAKSTWGSLGVTFLSSLEKALSGTPKDSLDERCHFAFCSIEDEIKGLPTIVTFKGATPEISVLGQFLSWIAATFRRPQHGKLFISSVDFMGDFIGDTVTDDNTATRMFRIRIQNLAPVDDIKLGSCWHLLFPSTVMASGFPVPSHPGTTGLRIPFDVMLELAGILYHVNVQDADNGDYGIYFKGMSSILYPTQHFDDTNVIQWHLVTDTDRMGLGRRCSPDDIPDSNWVKIRDFKVLSSATAILGYCGEAAIQLGTESRIRQYRDFKFSLSTIENPPPEASIGTVSAGFSFMGFGTAQAEGVLKYRKGLVDAMSSVQDITYKEILNHAETDPIILFETEPGNERAWLVPKLSVILDLLNYWAERNSDSHAPLRYAQPVSDGGRAAKTVLQVPEYANRVLIEPILGSEAAVGVGDIVRRIYGQMQRREVACARGERGARGTVELGRRGLLGWDLLELIEPRAIARRRTVNPHKTDIDPNIQVTPCWLPLTKVIPVYFGQGLGELITPIRPDDVCGKWRPIPGGFLNNYLVASVRCLVAISRHSGYGDCCIIFDDLLWEYTGESVFAKCQGCATDRRRACCKELQVLRQIRHNLTRRRERVHDGSYCPRIELNGAVAFGNREGIRLDVLRALGDRTTRVS